MEKNDWKLFQSQFNWCRHMLWNAFNTLVTHVHLDILNMHSWMDSAHWNVRSINNKW